MIHRSSSIAPAFPGANQCAVGERASTNGLYQGSGSFADEALERLESILRSLQCGPAQDQAIRLPEVLSIVGISKSTWYARLNPRLPSHDPRVPKPFKLGTSGRSPSVWWRSEVMAYVHACANAHAAY